VDVVSIARRASLALVATLLVACVSLLCAEPAAWAQGADDVQLTLSAQTPWNTPSQPRLDIKLAAADASFDAVPDPSLVVTIFSALPTRTDYALSLKEDVGSPILTAPIAVDPPKDPAAPIDLAFHLDVGFLERQSPEARVYPVKIELLSGSQHVAELRTPLIFLPRKPKVPLELAWTFVLGHPIDYGPDGTFQGRDLERRLGPGGSLSGAIAALQQMLAGTDTAPVDIVISPTLLEDLTHMQDGYRVLTGTGVQTVPEGEGGAATAAAALTQLQAVARSPRTELSAMPYGVPDLPQLERSGLEGDIPTQLAMGLTRTREVLQLEDRGASGTPDRSILRPPGSAIDPRTLDILVAHGVRTLLMDAGSVEQPRQENWFAPPATAAIGENEAALTAIVPDAGLDSVVTGPLPHDDPRLATQVLLGDLASIWLEQPDQQRSVAVLLGAEQDLPGDFFAALVRTLATAPWLRPTKAGQLAQRFEPQGTERYDESRVGPIPDRYRAELETDRELIAEWVSIIDDESAAAAESLVLTRDLLLTEGSYLVQREERGRQWLAWIEETIRDEFAKVRADTQQVVTLTSSGGRIPVRVTNDSDYALNVKVAIISSRLRFPDGSIQDVSLRPGQTQVLVFNVVAQTTGTFPVTVAIETPGGQTMTETRISVRSTAYNRVALVITLLAVLALLVVWARRRSRTRKDPG
jgi:hypothetical protein